MDEFEGLPRIDLRDSENEDAHTLWRARCRRSAGLGGDADTAARDIIAQVQRDGDRALVELTQKFEQRTLAIDEIELSPQRRLESASRVPAELREALEDAANRVLAFHRTQELHSSSLFRPGSTLESRLSPLHRVAVYAPGGTAAYPSSVLMAGIPAKVAGVPELLLFTPRASDVVVLAADFAGIDRIFEIGGAQAIAAAALGTETVPRVDKIVGPGNAYVTAAKRQVYGLCDIDGIAGPSEILVVADEHADPTLIAADLISQAEHDVVACPILVTYHEPLLDAVDSALRDQLVDLPRADIAAASMRNHGGAVLVRNQATMLAVANEYAPEHLELLVDNASAMVPGLTSAGAIFVGAWTPEAAGDYTAGPSHVLPTAGAARFGSPLGVWDFVKYTSVLELDEDALREQAASIITLARAEGLEGHARAVERRLSRERESVDDE